MKLKEIISKRDWIIIIIVLTVGLAIMSTMYSISLIQDRPFSELSRDPISVLQGRAATGLLSNIGMILWGISFCLLGCGWYMRWLQKEKDAYAILVLSVVTFMLYIDDFLMIHEFIIRDMLGLPEESMMVGYCVAVMSVIVWKFKFLWREGGKFLIIGFLFLGGSAGFDTVYKYIYIPQIHLLEDGFKLLGICFWVMFSIVVFTQSIRIEGKKHIWYND